jgi:hypothetical protein
MARLRVLEAEMYMRDGNPSSAARVTLLRLAVYHAPSVALALTNGFSAAYVAWRIMRALLRLVCAVAGAAMRTPGTAWRMALSAARVVAAHVA